MANKKGKNIEREKSLLRIAVIKYGIFIAIVLLFIFFGINVPVFLSIENVLNILRAISLTTLIAVAITVSIPAGGLNLSAPGSAGISMAVVAGLLIWNEAPLIIAILVACAAATIIGLAVAFLTVHFKIDDLLASLGLLFVAQGLELTYERGQSIYPHMLLSTPEGFINAPGTITEKFIKLGQGNIGPIPILIIIMFLVVAVLHFFFNNTKYGRFMYATGGNPEAARLAGIPINKYKTFGYLLSGFIAGIAGLLLCARLGSGQSMAANAYFLDSIAATFIGFSVLSQGKANVFGTFIGAVLMGTMTNGLTMMNVSYNAQNIYKGLILIGALLLSKIAKAEE